MKKVCIITGTRAEYGLLQNVIKLVQEDKELELQIVATGMHMTSEYGSTLNFIEADGYKVNKKIDILLSSGTKASVVKSVGLACISFSEAFEELKPDVIVLLGDRFESLAAAQSAMILNIPIAHIHGGERTEGQIDEGIRHSITKMSNLHFTANEEYKKRVIQLGERPEVVFNFGAPGLDNIKQSIFLSKEEIAKNLNIEIGEKFILGTYHPVTLGDFDQERAINEFLEALESFNDHTIVLTMPNSDPDSKIIAKRIDEFCSSKDNCHSFTSLGQKNYISAINACDVVIGNSSSGIIEVPFLRKPCVNIGTRQTGRLVSDSVINCGPDKQSIVDAIKKSTSNEHQKVVKECETLYGDGETSKRIVDKIKELDLESLIIKKFYDVKFSID